MAKLVHCVGTACNAHKMKPSQGAREEITLHSYPWWLVAVAKHNLLLRECVGRWWQPSGDIGILP